MNKSLKEVEEDIIEEFAEFDEWLDKYEYIIDLGKSLDSYPEDKKTDDYLIKGCQSRVWLDAKMESWSSMPTAMPSSPRVSFPS